MKYKKYKKIDKEISVLGFGGWQLGNTEFWGNMTYDYGVELVKDAINKGVNFFDTAPGYSNGLSERIIGEGIKGYRDKVFINTKFGHKADGTSDFSVSSIIESAESSCERLGTDYLDSIIIHNPEKYILEGKTDHFTELNRLKQLGKIKAYGVSVDSLEELKIILNNIELDVIEVMFNIIHQEVTEVFDEIEKRGILLIIKVPLDSGWLTGKYNDLSEFDGIRNRWDTDTKKTRNNIINEIKLIVNDEILVKYALSFILSFSAVTTVIPGVKNKSQLASNIESVNYELSEQIKKQLIDLYNRTIKKQNIPW
jgi:aryl-alcohol dehydrogenase-like predicted oxidoreductase